MHFLMSEMAVISGAKNPLKTQLKRTFPVEPKVKQILTSGKPWKTKGKHLVSFISQILDGFGYSSSCELNGNGNVGAQAADTRD